MNLQSIIITNCIGISLLLILQISSYLVRKRRRMSDKIFSDMIYVTILASFSEMVSFAMDGRQFAGAVQINQFLNSILYISNVGMAFMWCIYVDLRLYRNKERAMKKAKILGIPVILSSVVLIFNVKYHFIFKIDRNNVYSRTSLGNFYYVILLGYLIYSIGIRNGYYKKYGKSKFFPIYMFLAPIIAGVTAQFLFYGISVAWCSVALGLVGIYMSLQNELSYIDPLTKLYNRNYLDHVLKTMSRRNSSTGGLMIDLDYFKSINDIYGHAVGDDALVDSANIIRKVSAEMKAIPIRFAGDEFIVLAMNTDKSEIGDIEENIRNELHSFNEYSDRKYSLSFSIGSSIYSKGCTVDEFLKEMDKNMYDEKKTKHSR